MIMLVGIVKKNAIMMIDFALHRQRSERCAAPNRRSSKPRMVRFRPIMMTTMAALMGTLPIALRLRAPARNRAGRWACASRAACCLSQLLTLYITPVIYTYLDRLSGSLKSGKPRRRPQPSIAPAE